MEIRPTDALIIVDVQRDFCRGGALAVEGGDDIVPVISAIAPRFAHVVMTRDWHPAGHCSFGDPPQFVDGSWPAHCVQGSPGAQFHAGLVRPPSAIVVDKGADAAREAYSGLEGADLVGLLRGRGVERLFVCGLATDYCVRATALDGLRHGFEVVLLEDAVRGVDLPPGTAGQAVDAMRTAGAEVVQSGDVT